MVVPPVKSINGGSNRFVLETRAFNSAPLAIYPKLPAKTELIGGDCGRRLRPAEMRAAASAQKEIFDARGDVKGMEHYEKELHYHQTSFFNPFVLGRGYGGWPAVLFLRQGHKPASASEVADEAAWMLDDPSGRYLLFRKNIPDVVQNQGVRKTLAEAAVAYASELYKLYLIDGLLGFTRPFLHDASISIEDYWEKSNDTNILLYRVTGAKYLMHFKGACPNDKAAGGIMFMFEYNLGEWKEHPRS